MAGKSIRYEDEISSWPVGHNHSFFLSVQISAASDFEDELLVLINRYRKAKKLKPLVSSPLYTELAREHSQAMQEQGQMNHDGFDDRFRRAIDASSCVENVGWNHQTPQSLFTGWKESSGHNRNMLERRISRSGISRSGAYATFFACY
jgi:uncharacterized protein YkwD